MPAGATQPSLCIACVYHNSCLVVGPCSINRVRVRLCPVRTHCCCAGVCASYLVHTDTADLAHYTHTLARFSRKPLVPLYCALRVAYIIYTDMGFPDPGAEQSKLFWAPCVLLCMQRDAAVIGLEQSKQCGCASNLAGAYGQAASSATALAGWLTACSSAPSPMLCRVRCGLSVRLQCRGAHIPAPPPVALL